MTEKKLERKGPFCPFQQGDTWIGCEKNRCALWLPRGSLYTAENYPADGMCAITAIALKNQEGQIIV